MALFSPAMNATLLRVTGGEVVIDTASSESTHGHFDRVPVQVVEGEYGQVITTEPSVVVPAGVLTHIGPRKGVGRAITVDGAAWVVRSITAGDEDGGTIRLMLAEA
jgi:hypothetical protein